MAELLFPRPVNATGMNDFFVTHIDTLLGGGWGAIILFCVYSVSFIALLRFGPRRALATSAMIGFVVSLFMIPLGLAETFTVTLTGVILLAAVVLNSSDGTVRT